MRLNAICPYFTMFPLDFPLRVLRNRASVGEWVVDPFAGRGTTNYAARMLGLPSVGIDSSPVAAAITAAKLANVTPQDVIQCAEEILGGTAEYRDRPTGEFWSLAFHSAVLTDICVLRTALLESCESPPRQALRGVLLGALHGPTTKKAASHLSNQCTRTYAPKPAYSIRYWRDRKLAPPRVHVLDAVRARARRYYQDERHATGRAILGDSRESATFESVAGGVRWVVTSPPYFGMRTYVPDQWLRHWFVGGPATVEYSASGQLSHSDADTFASDLRAVWTNLLAVTSHEARLVIRFGGISDRKADPATILKSSIQASGWRLETMTNAGTADAGKRQAALFKGNRPRAVTEYDAWLRRV